MKNVFFRNTRLNKKSEILSARDPKGSVSDYHQRRMFAHGYHFIAEQVKDAQDNNNNNNNQTTQKLTFFLQERILRLEKQSLAITRRILRNQLAALKVSFEDFYTNYYNYPSCRENNYDNNNNDDNEPSSCEKDYDNIMIKMTRAAVKVCNQDFSDLKRDTRSSRKVFLTIWKGESVGSCGKDDWKR